ncbi:MAG: TolC family protein, partial [Pseudomonadales bacterium]
MHPAKSPTTTFAALCIAVACIFSTHARATTLQDIYELALNNDPDLQVAQAEYRAGDTVREQARALLLPQVDASYSYSETDVNQSSLRFLSSAATFPNSTKSETDSEDYAVTLTQNVFNLA